MENTDLFDFKVDNSVFEYNKNTFFTNMNYLKSNIINKIKQYESYNHYFDKIKSYSPYIYDYEYLKELETINQTVYQSDINDDFNEYEIKLSLEENGNFKIKFDAVLMFTPTLLTTLHTVVSNPSVNFLLFTSC